MAYTAYLPILTDRYGACVRHIFVEGLDLTGVDMRAQVRWSGDTPGPALVDLRTVNNGNAQGLRLVEVTSNDAGLPTSHVEIVINETTIEGLPYQGEIGDATQLAWDMQVTLAGRKKRIAKGEFEITGDGVTGAEAAPPKRVQGYGRARQPISSPWKAARLAFGEEQVTVQIVDAELVAPLAKSAKDDADRSESNRAASELAAATALASGRYYPTKAAGEAASAPDQLFSTDDGAGSLIYYRRTAGGSTEIGRAMTPAALADGAGAGKVGFDRSRPSVPATVIDRLLRDLYITDAPYSVPMDNSPADAPLQSLIDGLDRSGGAGWNLIVPRGRMRLTSNVNVPSRVVLSAQTHRSSIITLSTATAGFTFDSTEYGGMRGLRIGMDAVPGITAIRLLTSSTDIFGMKFDDLEIVGAAIENQRGFDIDAGNGHIIVECLYRGLLLSEIDMPVREYDSEGNSWEGCYINNFGYGGAKRALDLRTLASKHDFDVRGQPAAGSVAYRQAGAGNWANLVADIKATAFALDIPNPANHLTGAGQGSAANVIALRRAENFTPLGSFATGHTIIDNGALISSRALTRGSSPTADNFRLDGFGVAAFVEVVKCDDQGGRFIVHAAGSAFSPAPTVEYVNADGPYPFAPRTLLVQRNGGNQPLASRTFNRNCDVNGWNFQWDGTPADLESYEFDFLVR